MLDYLTLHKLPLTADSLFEAFSSLKSPLAQSDKGISYWATAVAFDERNQNPAYISTELRDSIRCKIARYTSSQYQDWLVRHPEEAAVLDEG